MSANSKRVFYFEYLQDPVYADILAGRPEVTLTKLSYASDPAENWAAIQAGHAYQVTSARDELPSQYWVDRAFLARCPGLLVVSTHGAGYDTIDVDACTEAGVIVVNQAGGNKEAVAEHVMAMMLCLSKRLIETDRVMRRQNAIPRAKFIGNDVRGKTIGIVGLGHVGTRVAELCRGLFEMRVLAFDPYLTEAECRARGAEKADLDALLRAADVVSVNCPLTRETAGMMDARAFGLMKPTALFVITARGGIVDEAALATALAEGRLAGAGVDVWEVEPPDMAHPLLAFDNVVVSPHTAGVTRESRHNIARIGAEQMLAILDGEKPPRLLNPDAWPRYRERYATAFGTPAQA